MMLYGLLGGKEFLSNSQRYLERRLKLECDGEPVELPQRLQGLVFLNIPSYMAGTNFWGTEREKDVSCFCCYCCVVFFPFTSFCVLYKLWLWCYACFIYLDHHLEVLAVTIEAVHIIIIIIYYYDYDDDDDYYYYGDDD